MRKTRRSGFIYGLVVIGLATSLVSITDTSQAASGNGPYYAEPAWDQKLPAATRFVVLTDWNSEAVLDRETGLVWEKSPTTTLFTWYDARTQCTNRTTGARKGWRLPSVHELASLVDPSVGSPGPTLPPSHPFANVQAIELFWYWSASLHAEFQNFVWNVSFFDGRVSTTTDKLTTNFVWCVRGGNSGDRY